MLRHLRNPQLLATYAVGFGVLFNFIATFTYHQLPPRRAALQSVRRRWLGAIFVVYLIGTALTPLTGGSSAASAGGISCCWSSRIWIGGIAADAARAAAADHRRARSIGACCGMLCQAVSTGYVAITARPAARRRSGSTSRVFTSAAASARRSAASPGRFGGWPACVAHDRRDAGDHGGDRRRSPGRASRPAGLELPSAARLAQAGLRMTSSGP